MSKDELRAFRERLYLQEQIPDEALDADLPPYFRPSEDSPEFRYMVERRKALSGSIPRRTLRAKPIPAPDPKVFEEFKAGSGKQDAATTMRLPPAIRTPL